MKKIIASAGLVALGTAGLQAAYAPGLTPMETSKPWSISASLRGFYDDNYDTAPAHPVTPGVPTAKSSFGVEVGPSFSLNLPMDQTYVGLNYNYFLRYYAERKNNSTDHNHEFVAKVEHRLNERYRIGFNDSFAYSQEPEVLDSNGTISTPIRTNADAIRNRAQVKLNAQLTEQWGVDVSYQNTWYHYFQSAQDVPSGIGSRGALLDRFEHLFDVNGRFLLQENLTAFAGYKYQIVDYTSNDQIAPGVPGTIRDNNSHFFYVGADYSFSSQLKGSIEGGAQYITYTSLAGDGWSPYVDLTGTYLYMAGSSLQVGFKHARNATDVAGVSGSTTADQETSTLYASINQKITPELTGSLLGQYQLSQFQGGPVDGKTDNFILLGLQLAYRLNQNWSLEAGYDFDRLDSGIVDRSFTRNRVYAGVRGTY